MKNLKLHIFENLTVIFSFVLVCWYGLWHLVSQWVMCGQPGVTGADAGHITMGMVTRILGGDNTSSLLHHGTIVTIQMTDSAVNTNIAVL